jgi:hypothetical protein
MATRIPTRLTASLLGRRFCSALSVSALSCGALFLCTSALGKSVSPRKDASALADANDAATATAADPPDPEPMLATEQWILSLEYRKGEVFLLDAQSRKPSAPVTTARAFGRFAVELWQNDVLVERVRFDFPLLGAGVGLGYAGVDFARGLTSRIGVLFPKTGLGDRLELVDRATRRRFTLPWPPPT